MKHSHWRRFLPRKQPSRSVASVIITESDVMNQVLTYVPKKGWSKPDSRVLDSAIDDLKRKVHTTPSAQLLEALLILQAPRAAQAQRQMDEHRGGYHNREERLYELIDFNDAFVSCVLALPTERLATFAYELQVKMATVCREVRVAPFTNEQFDAIVRGLSREIAVYRGALTEGFKAVMTSRTEDAFGIDMVVTDPTTHRSANIDCKTPSAFRHRLEDLVHEERITDAQLLEADEQDYCNLTNRRNNELVPVTLLCIRPETLGEIENFVFKDTASLAVLLRKIIRSTVR